MEQTCNYFNKYYNNAKQGEHYHRQLAPYIMKLAKVINDYLVARNFERNTLGPKPITKPSTVSTMPSSVISEESSQRMEIGNSAFSPERTNVEKEGKMEVEEIKESQTNTTVAPKIVIISSDSPKNDIKSISCMLPENFLGVEDTSSQGLWGYKDAKSTAFIQ